MPFSPIDLTPSLWLRADKDTYKDTAKRIIASPGETVAVWRDQSANAYEFVQTTAGLRPTRTAGAYNTTCPALTFAADYLTATISSGFTGDLTLAALVRQNVNPTLFQVFLHVRGGWRLDQSNGGNIGVGADSVGGAGVWNNNRSETGTGFRQYIATLDDTGGGNGVARYYLETTIKNTSGTLNFFNLSLGSVYAIGASSALSDALQNSDIVEIVVVPRVLTTTEQSDLSSYWTSLATSLPAAPTASFSHSSTGLTTTFTDTTTGSPTLWLWDFGDGNTSTSQNPVHNFAAAGTYSVSLTASNQGGNTVYSTNVTVSDPPPSPPPPPPTMGSPVYGRIAYKVEADFGRDGTFGHALANLTSRVRDRLSFSYGMVTSEQEFAPPSRLLLTLDNHDGAFNIDDNTKTYHGLMVEGVLIRVQFGRVGTTPDPFVWKITDVRLTAGQYGPNSTKTVTVTAEDPMLELLDSDFVPKLRMNVRVDEAMTAVFDEAIVPYPYAGTYWVMGVDALGTSTKLYENVLCSFEQAKTILPWVGDNSDTGRGVSVQSFLRDVLAAEAGGRFFWHPQLKKFVFHNRHHDLLTTSEITLTEQQLRDVVPRIDRVANVIHVTYEPREVGAPNSIIYKANNLPLRLRPGQTRAVSARYTSAEGVKTGASVVLDMQRGLDIIANSAENGTGADLTNAVGISLEPGGGSAKLTLYNPLAIDLYVTTLQLRGTPLLTHKRETVTAIDPASIAAYDRHEKAVQLRLVSDVDFAQNVAETLRHRYRQPVNRFESVAFEAQESNTLADAALSVSIGDRVTLQESWSTHNRPYVVVGVRHEIEPGQTGSHKVTWIVKPLALNSFFVLGSSALDGADALAL